MRRLMAALAGLALFALVDPAMAQADPATLTAAKRILEVTNAKANFERIVPTIQAQIVDLVRKTNPGQGELIAKLVDEAIGPEIAARSSELMDLMAQVYVRNFSLDEMQALLAFYDSPIGRKLIERQPNMTSESMAVGGAWGQKVGREAVERLIPKLRERGLNAPI